MLHSGNEHRLWKKKVLYRFHLVGLAQEGRPEGGGHPQVVQAPVVAAVGWQQQNFQLLKTKRFISGAAVVA
jgi:hypothetical protein